MRESTFLAEVTSDEVLALVKSVNPFRTRIRIWPKSEFNLSVLFSSVSSQSDFDLQAENSTRNDQSTEMVWCTPKSKVKRCCCFDQ